MGITKAVRTERRKVAEERNAEYAKLTVEQKLARLDASGFAARKQRAKLAATLVASALASELKNNVVGKATTK